MTQKSKHEEGDVYLSEIEVWTCNIFLFFFIKFFMVSQYLK